MKQFITPTYTFTPGISGVGTVDLSGISGFDIKRLIAIINLTDNILIYSTAVPALRHTNVAGTAVTLNYDTSSMSGTDVLQVIYEVPNTDLLPSPVTPATTGGSVYTAQITVGLTPVIATYDGNPTSAGRMKLMIKPAAEGNLGKIYLGGSGVTPSTGMQIIGPDRLEFDYDAADYYLVSDTAGQIVEILERY